MFTTQAQAGKVVSVPPSHKPRLVFTNPHAQHYICNGRPHPLANEENEYHTNLRQHEREAGTLYPH